MSTIPEVDGPVITSSSWRRAVSGQKLIVTLFISGLVVSVHAKNAALQTADETAIGRSNQ